MSYVIISNVARSIRTNHHFAINPSQIIYGDINEGISIYICRKEFRAGQISRIRAQIRRKVFFLASGANLIWVFHTTVEPKNELWGKRWAIQVMILNCQPFGYNDCGQPQSSKGTEKVGTCTSILYGYFVRRLIPNLREFGSLSLVAHCRLGKY